MLFKDLCVNKYWKGSLFSWSLEQNFWHLLSFHPLWNCDDSCDRPWTETLVQLTYIQEGHLVVWRLEVLRGGGGGVMHYVRVSECTQGDIGEMSKAVLWVLFVSAQSNLVFFWSTRNFSLRKKSHSISVFCKSVLDPTKFSAYCFFIFHQEI